MLVFKGSSIMTKKPKDQKQLIHIIDWDILLILDACRFDCFEKHIYKYVKKGLLQKVETNATVTSEWLTNTWDGMYSDITYISGNPYINSKGVSPRGFDATKHFGCIIDVWDFGYNKQSGRIEASELNKAAYDVINGTGRFVLHYVQPHEPYLYLNKKPSLLKRLVPRKLLLKIVSIAPTFVFTFFKKQDRVSDDVLRDAYERNLHSVLCEVEKIVDRYPDKTIIVTADHGEYLGEDGRYGHGGVSGSESHPILTSVPFFVVEQRELSSSDDGIVRERLRSLGYME